ncbi:hypothetical protein OO007_06750 [Cocleimonas sp. KMM 6892]|uniref:hypothetical protein n=1 Tax=unclassified Cocleimonas TaxID=2639732 RepID=UPI002DBB8A2A|nr:MULTISPECIES: hypothetical protein [unclassified Cocleimonas]MEB8431922.1 hypothetical protein [Cocleimonas sp. KMM 6892]MEC4714992.1 hypothetical protein [Cocleimonas sp. KMM 6895]MEC4744194.1 hypothetical protein [Cocleimonas sp. KMM 6896]
MLNKSEYYIFVVVTLLISGCSSNSGVVPLGNNSFIISKQAATGFPGTGSIKVEALKEASAKCLGNNQAVKIDNINESKPPYILGNYPKVDVMFHCINKT